MKADQVAVKAKEEFDDMVDETALSDYAVNEVDLGEIEINGKKMTVYLAFARTKALNQHNRLTTVYD